MERFTIEVQDAAVPTVLVLDTVRDRVHGVIRHRPDVAPEMGYSEALRLVVMVAREDAARLNDGHLPVLVAPVPTDDPEDDGGEGDPFTDDPEDVDPDAYPNGTCDVCGAAIILADWNEPRVCSLDEAHDCYGDGFANGGDPLAFDGLVLA